MDENEMKLICVIEKQPDEKKYINKWKIHHHQAEKKFNNCWEKKS